MMCIHSIHGLSSNVKRKRTLEDNASLLQSVYCYNCIITIAIVILSSAYIKAVIAFSSLKNITERFSLIKIFPKVINKVVCWSLSFLFFYLFLQIFYFLCCNVSLCTYCNCSCKVLVFFLFLFCSTFTEKQSEIMAV